MWKLLAGFIVFAGIALFIIFNAGDKVDLRGESGTHNAPEASSSTTK